MWYVLSVLYGASSPPHCTHTMIYLSVYEYFYHNVLHPFNPFYELYRAGASRILFALIRSCNRSTPHQELLRYVHTHTNTLHISQTYYAIKFFVFTSPVEVAVTNNIFSFFSCTETHWWCCWMLPAMTHSPVWLLVSTVCCSIYTVLCCASRYDIAFYGYEEELVLLYLPFPIHQSIHL